MLENEKTLETTPGKRVGVRLGLGQGGVRPLSQCIVGTWCTFARKESRQKIKQFLEV